MKALRNIKRTLKAFCETIIFTLSHRGTIADEATADGICDYSGQGR